VRNEIVALYLTGAYTYDQLARQYQLSSQSIYTYVRNHRKRTHTQ
jgi:transposase-like protein